LRTLIALVLALLPISAVAQQQDSFFDSYSDYERFVDSRIMNRDFIELIQVLGGRDEYTIEQLNAINTRFASVFTSDFTNRAVIKKTDLGEGFRQEMRVYWDQDAGYNYFYALLHVRGDGLVVLTFSLNSDVSDILNEF